jgi:hypothetical protein
VNSRRPRRAVLATQDAEGPEHVAEERAPEEAIAGGFWAKKARYVSLPSGVQKLASLPRHGKSMGRACLESRTARPSGRDDVRSAAGEFVGTGDSPSATVN